jgi:hypothetical protein
MSMGSGRVLPLRWRKRPAYQQRVGALNLMFLGSQDRTTSPLRNRHVCTRFGTLLFDTYRQDVLWGISWGHHGVTKGEAPGSLFGT